MLQEEIDARVIYLAEDDADDRILFMEALRELYSEIAVELFVDGQQLLENLHKCQKDKPEILFLDINMPRKNGFECLKEIRSIEHFDALKIIMLSTSSSSLHIEISRRLGADFYAIKPSAFHDLKDLLKRIFDSANFTESEHEFLL